MTRMITILLVAILSFGAVAYANEPTIISFDSEDAVSPWEVSYHKDNADMEMEHQVGLVSAPELEPLGVSQALQYTFELRSAWASVERPIEVSSNEVNEIVIYLRVNQGTRVMVMEAYEESGTRWRAKIRLRPDTWNEVILTPLDFFYLLGGEDRGGSDDLVRLSELNRIGFTVDGHEIDMGSKEIRVGLIALQ